MFRMRVLQFRMFFLLLNIMSSFMKIVQCLVINVFKQNWITTISNQTLTHIVTYVCGHVVCLCYISYQIS